MSMNALSNLSQAVFYLEAIVVTRYAFVYLLHNPVALSDDFFCFFLNSIATILSFGSQVAYVVFPGRNPLVYYICVGKFPSTEIQLTESVKPNLPVFFVLSLSCCTHIFTAYKLRQAKVKRSQVAPKIDHPNNVDADGNPQPQKVVNVLTDKDTLANLTSNVISLAILVSAYVIAFTMNKMKPEDVNKFPNYVFVFFWHHWMPQIRLLNYSWHMWHSFQSGGTSSIPVILFQILLYYAYNEELTLIKLTLIKSTNVIG